MYVCRVNSKRSGGDSLQSAPAASKYLSQGKEQEDLLTEQQQCIRRQARNVSVKGPTTQQMDEKEFRVFAAVSRPQSFYVSLHTVCEQNDGLQEMPLKAGIAWHVHSISRRRIRLHK